MKKFSLGALLNITTGRLVSSHGMSDVYELLNYMTREELFTHQLPRVAEECKPHLIYQHPFLDDPEISVMAIGELILMLDTPTGESDRHHLIIGWLSRLTAKYGDEFEIAPLNPEDHEVIDPITELVEKVGADRVIVIADEPTP